MPDLEIIAEAAQGYEGDPGTARLLIRAAAQAGADAVKFQIVYADDLATPGYEYYDLFRDLEMSDEEWRELRELARSLGLKFYADILGPQSTELAERLDLDGAKISTTCFYDDSLVSRSLAAFPRILLSIGGIPIEDVKAFFDLYQIGKREGLTILYGYQAEPTPVDRNNLRRIESLRDTLGVDVGFMDHADGGGEDDIALSAMALSLGVTVFEKHITLDRTIELEDYVSALAPERFAEYCGSLRRLATALGDESLDLIPEEQTYRGKACKRVLAAHDLKAGDTISPGDVVLLRPAEPGGIYRAADAIGRTLKVDVKRHMPIEESSL